MKKVLIADDMQSWRDFNSRVIHDLLGENIILDLAESANEAYNKVLENKDSPYDIIITDLQMENDYAPKFAGEWLVEQIQGLAKYYKTKIIMVSASNSIKKIAESLNVDFIPKSTAITCITAYEEILNM